MELEFSPSVASLNQIGKSNNSHIYQELDKNGNSLNMALKIIVHKEHGLHSKECHHLHNEYKIMKNLNHPSILKVSPRISDSKVL